MAKKKGSNKETKKDNTKDNTKDSIKDSIKDDQRQELDISTKPSLTEGKKTLKTNKEKRKKIEYVDIMESKSADPILSDILSNDDKILFSLNALGSLQKNEKLTEKDDLLSVDDRWFFQGIRRWWSDDSRQKSASKTLIVVSAATDRISKLLNDDFLAKIKEEKKSPPGKNTMETPEEKNFRETCEERRRTINKYFIALNKAKTGIENSRDTYDDKFTKNTFNLSIQRAEDILDKLQKFKGTV